MKSEEWEYDTVFFEGQIRKSGGSLVLTIPTELKDRFLLREGQKVRIIGLTKKKPYTEGGMLIYLGRFKITEKVKVLKLSLKSKEIISDEVIDVIYNFFMDRYCATSVMIEKKSDYMMDIEVVIGSITDKGVVVREKDIINKIIQEFKSFIKSYNIEVVDYKDFEDEITWNTIDPSVIKRYGFSIPENIKIEWIIF